MNEQLKPLSETPCAKCGQPLEVRDGGTFVGSTDGKVWHYGCNPPLTRPSPEADAWQPIETAPKDGSSILAIWRWGDDPINGAETHMVVRWCGWWDAHGFTQPEPTHWQPLPEPPALARTPAQEAK